ncbi:hypothetical protein RUM43_000345 [Polyplax serrata]|uniref:Uncharacterized protein n=1 Tax=Polyplax serrata TaxID=468196 RepID=A0AAN8XNW8_POLSC
MHKSLAAGKTPRPGDPRTESFIFEEKYKIINAAGPSREDMKGIKALPTWTLRLREMANGANHFDFLDLL